MDGKRRITDEEIQLIENTFKDNEALLISLRKVFIGAEITDSDKALLSNIKGETYSVVKKIFLPEYDVNAPIRQVVDLWYLLNTKIEAFSVEGFYEASAEARKELIKQLQAGLLLIENGTDTRTNFLDQSEDISYLSVETRKVIIEHIEACLSQLLVLSDMNKFQNQTVKQDSTK